MGDLLDLGDPPAAIAPGPSASGGPAASGASAAASPTDLLGEPTCRLLSEHAGVFKDNDGSLESTSSLQCGEAAKGPS